VAALKEQKNEHKTNLAKPCCKHYIVRGQQKRLFMVSLKEKKSEHTTTINEAFVATLSAFSLEVYAAKFLFI
jgi:hypothetical protein